MTQVNFNDKNANNNTLTTGDVNSLKRAVNDNEGLITDGSVSGYFDSSNNFRYDMHFIPASNANYDIGSAEYKVRHLFLSDNSMWLGDDSKMDASSGIFQSKTRDKTKLPNYITNVIGGNEDDALIFAGKASVQELTLNDLEQYAKSLNNDVTLSDIYPPEDSINYTAQDYESIFKQQDKQLLGPSDIQGEALINQGSIEPLQITAPFGDRIVIDNNGATPQLKIAFINLPKIQNFTFQTSLYVTNIDVQNLPTNWSIEVLVQDEGDPTPLLPQVANSKIENIRNSVNIIDLRLMYYSNTWILFLENILNFSSHNITLSGS